MANRIHNSNSSISLNVYDGIGHGYLHLVFFIFVEIFFKYKFVPQAKKANKEAIEWMKKQL
jgi:hypothetical protein